MEVVRNIVSEALVLRDEANIKVRQPLQRLSIKESDKTKFSSELSELIKDELNVKEVVVDPELSILVELDLNMNESLLAEGDFREFLRHVQALRKEEKLNPSDDVLLEVRADAGIELIVEEWKDELMKVAGLKDIKFVEFLSTDELSVRENKFQMNLVK
jgi:isoleucyl-tRNA synthetase